jgi:hypothetical protein
MSLAYSRSRTPASRNKVKSLKAKKVQLPTAVILLLVAEKMMSWVALGTLAASLGFYAWTVYLPKLWSKEYKKLETLQRHERQILATNASLKQQLAQQAEKPETGLANPQPSQSIFIRSVAEKPSQRLPSPKIDKKPPAPPVSEPMGY